MMWITLLKTTQWMNLLITGNGRDIGGASWEQNANAGNDSGNWGRTQQKRVNSLFEKVIAFAEETERNPS